MVVGCFVEGVMMKMMGFMWLLLFVLVVVLMVCGGMVMLSVVDMVVVMF